MFAQLSFDIMFENPPKNFEQTYQLASQDLRKYYALFVFLKMALHFVKEINLIHFKGKEKKTQKNLYLIEVMNIYHIIVI